MSVLTLSPVKMLCLETEVWVQEMGVVDILWSNAEWSFIQERQSHLGSCLEPCQPVVM